MEYVVVVILVLIALATGVWAYVMAGIHNNPNQEKPESASENETTELGVADTRSEEKAIVKKGIMATFLKTLKELSPRRWILLGICACLIGLAAAKLLVFSPGGISGMRFAAAAVMLLPVMIVDLNTRTIPNSLVLAMLAVGTAFHGMLFMAAPEMGGKLFLEAVIGLLGCLILFYVMARLTKDGMGMGDVKQLAALGWMVGLRGTLISALLGLTACTVMAIVLIVFKKKKARDSIPFGPFIFVGYLLAVLICNF